MVGFSGAMLRRGSSKIALVIAACSAFAAPALAQSDQSQTAGEPQAAPGTDASDQRDGNVEIVVTALKRSQSLQRVPAAVSVLSSESIEDRQLTSISDIATSIPNLVYSQQYGVALVAIRGVAPDGNFTSLDPSVALHVDGVYQPRPGSMNAALTDLDSIEVLRGPQGTLYGRNATGGVVNFRLKAPSDTFEGSISGLYGDYNRIRAKGFVSGPILPGISVRVSGLFERRDGYGLNLTTGNRYDDENNQGGRIALRLEPVSNLTIDLSGYYFYQDIVGPQIEAFSGYDPNGRLSAVLPLPFTLQPHYVYEWMDPSTTNRSRGATATVKWNVGEAVSLSSITGWVKTDARNEFDTVPAAINYSRQLVTNRSSYISQEFNLSANVGELGNLVAGLYYGREDNKAYLQLDLPLGAVANVTAPLSLPFRLNQVSTTKAVFGDATINLTDRIRLLGGLRYNSDEKEAFQIGPCAGLTSRLSYESLTGKAGAQADLSRLVMAYATFQTGFKAGGFNQAVCGDDFNPEKIKSYELGFRARTSDGALTLNATAFRSDYTDLQVSTIIPIAGIPSARIENAASAKIQGVEIESYLRPSSNVRFNISATYLDAHYEDYVPVNTNALNPANRVAVDLRGYQITKAPKVTVSVGGEFDIPVGGITATPRGEVFFSSKVHYTPFHDRELTQGAYALANFYLTLKMPGDRYRFSAYAKNLTNTAYIVGGNVSGNVGNLRGFYNEPRTYGGELTFNF